MKLKTIEVYEYKELSEKAKKKARNWLLECQDFEFEWDCIKDDAKEVGIKLTAWEYCRYAEGELLLDMTQVIANILKEHGEPCETYKTAKEYQAKYALLTEEQDEERETLEIEFTKAILEDYRIQADRQYEFIQSEEAVAETMEANEYEFDINGKRI